MKKTHRETGEYFIEKVVKLQEDAMIMWENKCNELYKLKINNFIRELEFLGSIAPANWKVNITCSEYHKMFSDLILEAKKMLQ